MSIGATRKKFILIGRRFGSDKVIRQANKTLRGLDLYLAVLLAFGASRRDASRLVRSRDELLQLGGGREEQVQWKMTSTRERNALVKNAKNVRRLGETLMTVAIEELSGRNDEETMHTIALIDATLAKTRRSGDDAFKLKTQLDDISIVFAQARVQEVIDEDRGGPDFIRRLDSARADMGTVLEELKPERGTPESTEQINVLDGEIVTLCRRFRAIARLAANELGRPALAEAFELDELYGSVRRKAPETEETAETPEGESAAG